MTRSRKILLPVIAIISLAGFGFAAPTSAVAATRRMRRLPIRSGPRTWI